MANASENSPEWLQLLNLSRFELFPAATEEQIVDAESAIGFSLPADYRDFLKISNGATIKNFIFYPICPLTDRRTRETAVTELHRISKDPNVWPVFAIGLFLPNDTVGFIEEDFEFSKANLGAGEPTCPVYLYFHESGESGLLTNSLRELLHELSGLPAESDYVPNSLRDVERRERRGRNTLATWLRRLLSKRTD